MTDSLSIPFSLAAASEKTVTDYRAEQDKLCTYQAAREQAYKRFFANECEMDISPAERAVIDALAAGGDQVLPLLRGCSDVLKTPDAIVAARAFLGMNLQEANAARMMALIARDHHYEETMRKARAGQAEVNAQEKAHRLRAENDKKEMQKYAEQSGYYATDIVKIQLEGLRKFDKEFLAAFNGPMLDLVQALMAADEALAIRPVPASPRAERASIAFSPGQAV